MTLIEAVKSCFCKYFTSSGRASRSECFTIHCLALVWIFIAGFAAKIAGPFPDGDPTLWEVLLIAPALVASWPIMVTAQRRGQDAGLRVNPFVILLFGYGAVALLDAAVLSDDKRAFTEKISTDSGDPSWFGKVGGVMVFVAYVAALSWPSEPGQNAHGPNPLEATS